MMTETSSPPTLKEIMAVFGMTSSEFAKEWKQLTPDDKADIKNGIGDGSMNY